MWPASPGHLMQLFLVLFAVLAFVRCVHWDGTTARADIDGIMEYAAGIKDGGFVEYKQEIGKFMSNSVSYRPGVFGSAKPASVLVAWKKGTIKINKKSGPVEKGEVLFTVK